MTARILHPNRLSRLDIELDLMPTDRIFQRWSRSVGNELSSQGWGENRSLATALPDDAAILVDQYVCAQMWQPKHFLHAWYRGQDPSPVIAKRFSMSQDGVYLYWRAVLWSARDQFTKWPEVAHLMQKHLDALAAAA